MNTIERIIYNRVRFTPRIKYFIVKIYQYLLSIIPIKSAKSDFHIVVREGYFYGFHDKCPWSYDNKYVLAHKYAEDLIIPGKNDSIEVGYLKDSEQNEFVSLANSNAWNWQMGSMLQWLGNDVIFNDFDGSSHISRVFNLNAEEINKFNSPIAALNSNGDKALSHSFVRLRKAAPAYGYAVGSEESENELIPNDTGIHLLNLNDNTTKMLFSISEIVNNFPVEYTSDSYHYFTHCLFSPSGHRFAFYHRWVEPNSQTWTRLFTSDINGKNIFKFDFSGVVTHLAWQNDVNILAYGLKKDLGDNYYLLEDQTDNFNIIGENCFSSDGHPQFTPNKKEFVTDTYPDRFRRQRLSVFDLDSNTINDIAILRSPLAFIGDVRCDLHPRWDRLGKQISFDSAHSGKRALCTINVN